MLGAQIPQVFLGMSKNARSLYVQCFVGVVGLDNFQRTRLIEKVYGREMNTIWFLCDVLGCVCCLCGVRLFNIWPITYEFHVVL